MSSAPAKSPADLIRLHTTGRCRQMERYENFARTTQYRGRAHFFNDGVPLFQRAPLLVFPIVAKAIDSHVGLMMSKDIVLTTAPDEDDSTTGDDFGLNEEDSKKVDRLLSKMSAQIRGVSFWKRVLRSGMSCGSAVGVASVRNAALTADAIPARFCTPRFNVADPSTVESIEIRYPYIAEEKLPSGQVKKKVMLYRRVIDTARDVTFLPVDAPEAPNEEPAWKEDETKRYEHNLGFCPVVWYKYMPDTERVNEYDGAPIHKMLLDEIEALDFSISQRHRAVLYQGDPITVEYGVNKGFNPSEPAAFSVWTVGVGEYDGMEDPEETKKWRMPMAQQGQGKGTGRKRGPGSVWQYESKKGDQSVELLTLPSDAVTAMSVNAKDLEQKIADALHFDMLDPKEMQSGASLSGRALELLYKKQVAYDNDAREDFGQNFILPFVQILLRIILKVGRDKAKWFRLSGVKAALPILERFEQKQRTEAGGESTVWVSPDVKIKWPPYFEASETDEKATAETTAMLVEKGLLKLETGVARVAKPYGIENPAQYAEDMEAERKRKAEEQMAMMQKAATSQGGPTPTAAAQKPPAAPTVKPKTEPKSPPAPKPPRAAKPSPFKKRATQPSPAMG